MLEVFVKGFSLNIKEKAIAKKLTFPIRLVIKSFVKLAV